MKDSDLAKAMKEIIEEKTTMLASDIFRHWVEGFQDRVALGGDKRGIVRAMMNKVALNATVKAMWDFEQRCLDLDSRKKTWGQ